MFEIQYPNYKQIIEEIDEATICSLFFPSIKINTPFHSLYRKDSNASARFYYNLHGRLCYNDFIVHRTLDYLLMEKFNLNSEELSKAILDRLNKTPDDFTYTKQNLKKYSKKHTIIEKKARGWLQHDIEYWGQFGITKEWLSNPKVNVEPITKYWVDNDKGRYCFNAPKYCYCYNYFFYNDRMLRKIYQPYSQDFKWTSNVVGGVGGVLQLWETLPKYKSDLLIISSSLKDSGTIYCNTFDIFNRNRGIYSIAPNNETGFIPDQVINKLKQRFDKILVFFDQDDGGHLGANKYRQQYGWDSIFVPEWCGTKDPSDFRAKYGQYEFIKLIEQLLKKK